MQLYIPDGITDDELALTFTPAGYQKLIAELFRTRTERDTALADKSNAESRITSLLEQGQNRDADLNKAQERITELLEQAANADEQVITLNDQLKLATDRGGELAGQVETLKKLLEEAQRPTPDNGDDVWPDEPAFVVAGHAAFTVEKGQGEPSPTIYKAVREALFWAWDRRIGVDVWRGFLNPSEVIDHQKPSPKFGNLVRLGRYFHMHFVADTVDCVVIAVNDIVLKAYLEGLEKLKARALVFNDADQYGIEGDKGLRRMIARVRQFTSLPIILSLRGTADAALYKSLGTDVYIEIQTFGSVEEMKNIFLKKVKTVDIFCLAAFKAMNAAQLKALFDTVLAAEAMPRSLYFYTDLPEDWPAMPQSEVDVLKNFVTQWKAKAVKTAA